MESVTTDAVEWAVASAALEPGESGDSYLIHPLAKGMMLALVDGVGHGWKAAAASRAAIALLAAGGEQPIQVFRDCHAGLRETRGAVVTGVWIDPAHDRLTWLAVGDVQGVLLRVDRSGRTAMRLLVGRAGVVGRLLPALRASLAEIATGDLVVLASDGIRRDFTDDVSWRNPPQRIADEILARYRRGTDDAMVLVARYRGGAT